MKFICKIIKYLAFFYKKSNYTLKKIYLFILLSKNKLVIDIITNLFILNY